VGRELLLYLGFILGLYVMIAIRVRLGIPGLCIGRVGND